MASIAELVRVVANVEGFEENFVSVYARSAREAGLISHHGRGRNAARMTPTDAAHLLIAVNASPLAKEVPEVIARYGELRLSHSPSNKLREERQIAFLATAGLTFTEALSFLLDVDPAGELNLEALVSSDLYGYIPSPPPRPGRNDPVLDPGKFQHQGDIGVDFRGTHPSAVIRIRNYQDDGKGCAIRVELLRSGFYFMDYESEHMHSDRTVTTSITTTTLRAVAELIHS